MVFASYSDNLVPDDNNGEYDVFAHDRVTSVTTRVSIDSSGVEGNSYSSRPSISGDGRYVAFESGAYNLVPGDTNGVADSFVRDRLTMETTRVTVSTDGVEGNGSSYQASISGDGRYVAFLSLAENLVPGDTNGTRNRRCGGTVGDSSRCCSRCHRRDISGD